MSFGVALIVKVPLIPWPDAQVSCNRFIIIPFSKSSIGKEAASEVLKTESVLQLMGSSMPSTSEASGEDKPKKLSYSEVVKSDSKDGKDKEDPIADWGKPLGLPSPIRPSTPAKQPKKTEDDSMDTNKVTFLLK